MRTTWLSRDAQPANGHRRLALTPIRSSTNDVAPEGSRSESGSHAGSSAGVTFTYRSDNHFKATLEDAFGSLDNTALKPGNAPWKMGWQMNERNLLWNDDLKLRLIKKLAAEQAQMSDAELDSRIESLLTLMPDISRRLKSMKPELIVRLVTDIDTVAAKLLELKAIFPRADCGKMLCKELGLLLQPADSIVSRAAELRAFLPNIPVDILVQDNPSVLSVDAFKSAVEDAARMVPGMDIERTLMTDADFVLSLQKGSDMIPYDAVPENPWGHK